MLLNPKIFKDMDYALIYSQKDQNTKHAQKKYDYLESLSHKTNIFAKFEKCNQLI